MRPFVEKTNRDLTARIGAEVKSLFPIVSADGKSTLSVSDVSIDTSKFDPSDLNAQQKAREQGLTRAVPIFGQLSLTRDGKVIQKRKIKLGELPLMNDLTTYSVQGNDWYTPLAQLRLKSGAYTREKANGLFETFIRTQGRPMTVWMDPAKGNFKFGYGTTNVSLYSVLREMGATDADIIAGLGGDDRARALLSQNRGDASERDIPRLYEAVLGSQANKHLIRASVIPDTGTETDRAAQGAALQGFFTNRTVLDPFVTRHTLGKPFEHVDRDMLLASAKRILDVYRGDAEPDDRDAPEYKKAFGIEDLMAERLRRFKNSFTRVVQRRLGKEETLGNIIPHDWLNPATVGYFGGAKGVPGGLASTAEAANPLAILSEGSKLTLRGDGGIQSDHAITMGARMFKPTALNFVDPVRSPEGSNIGVTTHAASNVIRDGQQLKAPFLKCTDGKVDASKSAYISVELASDSVIGYPEEWDFKTGKPTSDLVRAIRNGQVAYVKPEEVDYVIPSGSSTFDFASNAALFLAHTHANRAMMAGKHLTQALPLVNREKPLVTLKAPFSGRDMLESLGRSFVIRSNVDGTVDKVSDTAIFVDGVKHTLFNQYPMQAKVALNHVPVVKVGDKVTKGQLLADSNYSREGSLALGVNLRSAYTPWKNAGNFEDAIAISETAAKKLTSEHVHREKLMLDDDMVVGTNQFTAQFPTQLTLDNAKKMTDDGLIKPGSVVQPGEVLVAAVRKRTYDPEDRTAQNLGRVHKSLLRPWMDAGLRWEEDFPGTVLRVLKLPDHIEVHLLTHEPAQIGDKLSMSSAAKGTISTIIPDDKAPRDKKGRPIEILFNPIGVLGRINPSQTVEQMAGKLVRDGGVSYSFSNFDGVNHPQVLEKELKRVGLSREEILFDPEEGRDIERPVATGYNYVFKLDHPVRKKFSARGRDGYTMDEAPVRGKGKGGQAFDHLTTYALLGHNAHAILRESFGVRGTKNDDYWLAYQTGERPPPPKVPFVFERFRNMLRAAGVDTKQHGNVLHYMPITDKRVLEMSNGAIQNALHVRAKDLKEEKGGLFDLDITGGNRGTEWAHIDLGQKIPHPMYEKVLRDVLGLKQAEMYGLIAGTLWYDPKAQKFFTEDGPGRMTGEAAFEYLLDFDVDDKLSDVKARLKTAVGSDFNRLHRASRYLRGLKDTKMRPAEAYLSSKVPVIPPMYRSVTEMRRGELRVDPSNLLYRDIILAKDLINQAEKDKTLPSSELGKARLALYDGYAALVGVGKSLTDRRDEDVPGFADVIKGKTNKQGLFQRQLTRRRNDFTGRSTIEPDANLGVDEIGIPEPMAWKMYEPTLVRRMVQGGWLPADAAKQVADQSVAARNVLQSTLEQHPVLYSRAPSLHKWNVMAAIPHLTSGQEIKISPLVVGPNNADYDGDTMMVHVPISEEARLEAYKLLPSKNLFYDRDRSLAYGPEKDVIAGVFALTRPGRATGLSFKSTQEAIDAYKANKSNLRMDSMVRVSGVQGTPTIGQLIFLNVIPARFQTGLTFPIDRKKMDDLLTRVAKEAPTEYNRISRNVAMVGFQAAAMAGGITATIGELALDRGKINQLLAAFEKQVQQKPQDAQKLYEEDLRPKMEKLLDEHLAGQDIGYRNIVEAGAGGSKGGRKQLLDIMLSPVLVKDEADRVIPAVIKSSYGSGMSLSDYVLSTPGARAGMVAKSLSTAMPGFLAKEIAGNVGPTRIMEEDCGTHEGLTVSVEPDPAVKNYDADLLDRHLLEDVAGFRRNDPVTPSMLSVLRGRKVKEIKVRSPMTCEAASPPCQMCAGRAADGKLHPIGSNIGLNYGQTLGERSTQLVLRSFHSGGSIGAGDSISAGFVRLKELLSAPDVVRNQGTLADTDGLVTDIHPAPQGGWYVMVDKDEHYVAPGRTLKVKLGQRVQKGDPLSDGTYRPQELAAKKGLLAAQQYVVDETRKAYQAAGAVMRKPVIEVVAAATMRNMEVLDDGGEKDLAPGDVLHENEFKHRQRSNSALTGRPVIPGLSKKPLLTSNDLMERLNFQRLEDTMHEVPASAGRSDLLGTKSPIPGLAYGAMFRNDEITSPFAKRAELEGEDDP